MSSPQALPIVCASARRRASERGKPAIDAAVDDAESEVVEIFSSGCPSSPASSRNIFILIVHRSLITRRCILAQINLLEDLMFLVASS
jgi:hypothetical protein